MRACVHGWMCPCVHAGVLDGCVRELCASGCMHVKMRACVRARMRKWIVPVHACVHGWVCACMSTCMYGCTREWVGGCEYVWACAWMGACGRCRFCIDELIAAAHDTQQTTVINALIRVGSSSIGVSCRSGTDPRLSLVGPNRS